MSAFNSFLRVDLGAAEQLGLVALELTALAGADVVVVVV